MKNIRMNTTPIWRSVSGFAWKLVERPNSFYYFVKDDEEDIWALLRVEYK